MVTNHHDVCSNYLPANVTKFRPVPLDFRVIGVAEATNRTPNDFLFQQNLRFRVWDVISRHGFVTLVTVACR